MAGENDGLSGESKQELQGSEKRSGSALRFGTGRFQIRPSDAGEEQGVSREQRLAVYKIGRALGCVAWRGNRAQCGVAECERVTIPNGREGKSSPILLRQQESSPG